MITLSLKGTPCIRMRHGGGAFPRGAGVVIIVLVASCKTLLTEGVMQDIALSDGFHAYYGQDAYEAMAIVEANTYNEKELIITRTITNLTTLSM